MTETSLAAPQIDRIFAEISDNASETEADLRQITIILSQVLSENNIPDVKMLANYSSVCARATAYREAVEAMNSHPDDDENLRALQMRADSHLYGAQLWSGPMGLLYCDLLLAVWKEIHEIAHRK